MGYKKRDALIRRLYGCTPGRDRTGKDVTPLVFETNASTNSATRAFFHAANVEVFYYCAKFF